MKTNQSCSRKIIAELALCLLAPTAALFAQTTPVCAPAPSGLAAWWTAEGNIYDVVGGNNGQAFGTLTFSSNGEVGQAFFFNGSNSYVQVPSSAALKPAGPFSVEAWIYYDRLPGNSGVTIATKGVDAEAVQDWALNIFTSGKLRPHIFVGGSWVAFNCATTLATNMWHHVAMVYDGSTVRGYVNGVQDGSMNVTGMAQTSDNPVRIGAYAPVNGISKNFFSGGIDELSLYSRALSASEIAAIYNAQSAGKCALVPTLAITGQPQSQSLSVGDSVSFSVGVSGTPPVAYQWRFNGTNIAGATNTALTLPSVQLSDGGSYSVEVSNVAGSVTSSNAVLTVTVPVCVPAPAGLVAWWKGDGSAYDAASTHDGLIVSNVSYAVGKAGQGFSFDATNSHVSVPHSPEWDFGTNEFTVEFWVNFRRINATQSFLGHSPGWGSANNKWIFWLNGGVLQFLVDGPSGGYHVISGGSFSPTLNRFHHLAVVRRGGVFVYYVDGAVAGTVTNALNIPPINTPLKIGQVEVGTFLDGTLDEVGIYNRGLLSAEIAAIYNAQSAGKCALVPTLAITGQPQSQSLSVGDSVSF
ncbi:MAG: immunoglobulin domain-containing protein, partial [Verrucomicrobia bacterium]|nr:immunoglobulin domain-containing protein [Verrucomicrobiota bacterium]